MPTPNNPNRCRHQAYVDSLGAVPSTRTISTTGIAQGGGNLSVDRTIDVPIASQAEAQTGSDNTKGMTPLRTWQAIQALQLIKQLPLRARQRPERKTPRA